MLINKENAKAIVKYLDAEKLKELHPHFNVENWDLVKAMADGRTVILDSCGALRACGFDAPREDYSIKRKTIKINGIEVAAPYVGKIPKGVIFYMLNPYYRKGFIKFVEGSEYEALPRGMVFLDEKQAQEAVAALDSKPNGWFADPEKADDVNK